MNTKSLKNKFAIMVVINKKIDFQIVSDLHIEYKNNEVPDPFELITPVSKILILAGDIGSLYKYYQLKTFLKAVGLMFEQIFYVPGNHEFYTVDNIQPVSFTELLHRLKCLENYVPNLKILNQSHHIIGDVCIAGCTLWSETDLLPKFIVRIADFNKYVYNKIHKSDVNFIENMIKKCQNNNLELIMVTHHCPTFAVMDNMVYKKDRFKNLYATNLEHLLSKDKVSIWICGHIHSNFDFMSENGTRIVGNQKGKPKDKIVDFSTQFLIQIDEDIQSNIDFSFLYEEFSSLVNIKN